MQEEKQSLERGLEKKGQTFQMRMILSMIAVFLLFCVTLVVALTLTSFFYRVDQQSIESFYSKADQKVADVNVKIANIVENTVSSSRKLSLHFTTETAIYGESLEEATLSASHYVSARVNATDILLNLLDNTAIDGAFYVLFEEDSTGHTGVHIRNMHPTRTTRSRDAYELVVGSSGISQGYNLAINANWDLYYNWDFDSDYNYLKNPLEAMEENPYNDLESYGYWHVPYVNAESGSLYYILPVLDSLDAPFALIGIEISADYFLEEYMSVENFAYQDSFHILGNVESNVVELYSEIPNQSATSPLDNHLNLTQTSVGAYPLYTVWADGLGELLCSVHSLNLYSTNSAFAEEEWHFLTFVPSAEPYKYSREIIDIFIKSFVIVFLIGGMGIYMVSRMATRKIVGLSDFIKNLNPHQELVFEKTNLREIDELTAAMKMLNQKVMESSATLDRIIRLTDLNLGGYEILAEENGVVVTEYIRKLLHMSPDQWVSLEEWRTHFTNLTKNPNNDVENTYQYVSSEGVAMWLRIIHSDKHEGGFGMVMDVTREMEESIEVKNKLDYDALTQLYSRAAFHREAKRLIQKAPDAKGAMLFIDLDNLKYTNDTFGHETGDLLIRSASDIFRQFHEFGGVAARFSGDEFAIYVHGYESTEELLDLVSQKFAEVKNATITPPDGVAQRIRFSTGIAWYPNHTEDVSLLVKYADFAMYRAKHNAKGTMRVFDPQEYDETSYMMDNREAINKLIEEGLVKFMFQPIVDLHTGEIFAYEALMRSEINTFKTPMEVLNVAASQSKSGELEQMLIQKSIAFAYEHRKLIGKRKIFINSITSQSISDDEFMKLQEKYGDFLRNIVMELKQTDAETLQERLKKVSKLRESGMQIAIDDFTAGFTNEMSISSVHPDLIKMDMSLGQGISEDKNKRDLLKSSIQYPKSQPTEIKVIVEGIEHFEDLQQVMLLGADYVQGFVVGHPQYQFSDIKESDKQRILDFRKEIEDGNVTL